MIRKTTVIVASGDADTQWRRIRKSAELRTEHPTEQMSFLRLGQRLWCGKVLQIKWYKNLFMEKKMRTFLLFIFIAVGLTNLFSSTWYCNYSSCRKDSIIVHSTLLTDCVESIPDRGICVGTGVFTSGTINGRAMMQHEFGHVLQYRMVGAANYYNVIAKESILNCGYDIVFKTNTHSTYWTETWANYLSKQYFGTDWLGYDDITRGTLRYYPAKNINTLIKVIKFGLHALFF